MNLDARDPTIESWPDRSTRFANNTNKRTVQTSAIVFREMPATRGAWIATPP
jgi:hypothetical protein